MLPLVCVGVTYSPDVQASNGNYYHSTTFAYIKNISDVYLSYSDIQTSNCYKASTALGYPVQVGMPNPAEYYNMTDTILYGAFSDGAVLGWGIVGAMVVAWCIMVLVRASK